MAPTGNVRVVAEDDKFLPELEKAGTNLVIVDFTASWCGPCQRIAPVYADLSVKYPAGVFLKVDVDQCEDTAAKYGVTSMPTFLFFRSKVKVDEVVGANAAALEEKIKQHIGGGEEEQDFGGHMDLTPFINKQGCECLNESDEHGFANILEKTEGFLESDCDEQLLMTFSFSQAVKVHSLKIHAPDDGHAPKSVKIFINQPNTLDFDKADSYTSLQSLELTAEDCKEDALIPLKYVKFQNVLSMTMFIKDNQGGEETTIINNLAMIGSPLDTTNMTDFKRVAGKKGESH